jgi:hypothetical protein
MKVFVAGADRRNRPPPPQITKEQARAATGEDAIYYGTKLRGASNAKAKKALRFTARRLKWLAG